MATAPTELAASYVVPASEAAITTDGIDYDAIRERLGLVVETFSRATVGFPETMPADEAAAILAISDAEIDDTETLTAFAHKWGVSLDWLIEGDLGALIHYTRAYRERERAEDGAAGTDPAIAAYDEWREVLDYTRPIIHRHDEMSPGDLGEREANATATAAEDEEIAAHERLAEAVPTTLEGMRLQLIAMADAVGGLLLNGNASVITDYDIHIGNHRLQTIQYKLMLALYAGIGRLVADPNAQKAADAIAHVRTHEPGA
ncbi:MAG: hypothetical protein AAFR84_19840 [Pseudomonadota bacterium]